MVLLPHLLSTLAVAALYPAIGTVSAKHLDRNQIQALRNKAADRFSKNRLAGLPGGDVIDVKANPGVKNITFSNPAASGECHVSVSCESRWLVALGAVGSLVAVLTFGYIAFYVDGTTIPDVDWDIGPSWAGLLPISGNANETREVSSVFPA